MGGGKASSRKASASSHKKSQRVKKVSAERAVFLFRRMLEIRRFEERAGQVYGMGEIGGFCHLYVGQEAVVVGVKDALEEQDSMITGYREHGHMLACGVSPKDVMSELTGRASGCSGGKGGSMHLFAPDAGFYGGHGIVGAQVPLGTGIALRHLYEETGGVCATFFGDGASNQGQVYEAFNIAALWHLPVLYIIENNRYGMGTSVQRAAAGTTQDGHRLWARGRAYGIPGEEVDGMDVLAVRSATLNALEHCRKRGPYILEMETYRYRGHSMSDPAKYRTKEEVQGMRERHDAIERQRSRLLQEGWASEDEIKTIESEVRDTMKAAAEFATTAALPCATALYEDVYADAAAAADGASNLAPCVAD